MRMSKSFVKTLREAPKEETATNGALLTRAGYIRKEMAGIYASYYLDTASGPMVVLAQGTVFALAYLFSPRQGVVGRAVGARTRRRAAAA